MSVTNRLEKTVKALEQKQLKKALFLTDKEGLERHHQWVEEAARTCIANRNDKQTCDTAIKQAKEKIQETITAPLDDASLEGLEEYMSEERPIERERVDELESCEECHISDAVVKFHEIAEGCGDAATMESIQKTLEDEPPPEQWLKAMVSIAEKPSCGEESYQVVLGELTDYLQKRDSPILKKLEE